MKIKIVKSIFVSIFLCLANLHAGESTIPLKSNVRLPSDDLIYGDQVLSSKEASELKHIDLSLLNPRNNEIYSGVDNSLSSDDAEIALSEMDSIDYQGMILSNEGLLRFNAISKNDGSLVTIHLDKTLHSMLLRKNLLRKLGYVIPAMKYLKKVKVSFSSKEEKETFLKKIIPENTLGAIERWVVEDKDLDLTLQDVAVTVPSEEDFYNVALGVPSSTMNSRTIRSLVTAYSLVDLHESVEQYSWSQGKVDNNAIVLSHFTGNEFNSSIDDVLWMQNKINNLTRKDFEQIVKDSYFPRGVSELIVEKLISRRNVLNKNLNLDVDKIEFDKKIQVDGVVVKGKLTQQNFKGYAARFSYGDAQTPFDQIRYYLYAKLQSNIIDNAISYLNKNMIIFDTNEKRAEYFKNQFDTGLQHFIKTGELLPVKIGAWISPLVNFKLILSRDIILGNYLGTDNMVQLADTVGAGVDLGLAVGVEGLPYGIGGNIRATDSLVRTFTHLKPVKSLKESLKEPYRNLFVPLLKHSLKKNYLTLSELKDYKGKTEERNKKIQEVFSEMDKKLGVGESLIVTDRIMPTAQIGVSYSQGIIGGGVGIRGGLTVLKRIHFYKKAPQILQVLDDLGHTKTIDLSFQVSAVGIPFLKVNQEFDSGKYLVKSYMVNLNSNVDENPDLFQNALGLYEVLKNKNFEILNSSVKPVILNAKFNDSSSGFSFLLWKMKGVKGQTFYDVEAKDGVNGKYFSYRDDFLTGANAESMSKQMANYLLKEKLNENLSITDENEKNPGQTIYGKSHTEAYRFEAALDESGKFTRKFISFSDVREGWTQSERKLLSFIDKVNKKFNFNLFNKEQIDLKRLKMYRIGYTLNMYESGIVKLSTIKEEEINVLEKKYKLLANCSPRDYRATYLQCGNLGSIRGQIKNCKKDSLKESERAVCQTELFEKLFTNLKFDDFVSLIGIDNFYLYATIDGYRKNSEVLNDTIYSNSIGKIGSQFWNGPLEVVKNLVGLSDGEFSSGWLRVDL